MKPSEIIKKTFFVADAGGIIKVEPDPSGMSWGTFYQEHGSWILDDNVGARTALGLVTEETHKVFVQVEVEKE